jgi:hypothetical protein
MQVANAVAALKWMVSLVVVSLLSSGVFSPSPSAQDQLIDVPAFASGVECSQRSGGVVRVDSQHLKLPVKCAEPSEILSCDGPSVEPVDVETADICKKRAVPFSPSSVVRLGMAPAERTMVQWLDLSNDQVRILATRPLPPHTTSLQVANRANRFVRISRAQSAPVTLAARDIVSSAVANVPTPTAGSEVVIVIKPSVVVPTGFRVTGPETRLVERQDATYVAIRGLVAGSYSVVPTYGSLTGFDHQLRTSPSESTVMFLDPEPVGGVTLSADAASCQPDAALEVWRLDKGRSTTRTRRFASSDVGACRWVVAGLRQGHHEATLRSPRGSGGSQFFDVEPQRMLEVNIPPPNVVVSGVITTGGRPAVARTVRFAPLNGGGGWQAVSDDSGRYEVWLSREGDYMVFVGGSELMEQRMAVLKAGENTLDLALGRAAQLTVRIANAASEGPVEVHLSGSPADAFMSVKSASSATAEVQWDDVPYGRYTLSAQQAGAVSDVVPVTLDANRSKSIVDLTLNRHVARLSVRDELGHPIEDARFAPLIRPPTAVAPGVYSLEGVAPGTCLQINVSGRFVPVSRLVQVGRDLDIVMVRGRPTIVEVSPAFLGHQPDGLRTAMLVGLPGSDCPLPLVSLRPETLPPRGDMYRFALAQFPAAGEVTLVMSDGEQWKLIASDDRIILK